MRALVRAALNERALERYILIWLSDASSLEIKFEPWAFMRDNEATNLLPSIAAGKQIRNIFISFLMKKKIVQLFTGLGSILFAITVDSRDLNIPTVAEYKNRSQEIIIAVPTVSKERKIAGLKRTQIISFDNDNESPETTINNNVSQPIPVLQSKSLSSSCLKYKQPPTTTNLYNRTIASSSDSILDQQLAETLASYDIVHSSSPHETDYLEPESPSSIKMFGSLPSTSDSMKEAESSISKTTTIDSCSTTSNANTTNSSSRQPSRQSSTSSSMNSVHQVNGDNFNQSIDIDDLMEQIPSPVDTKLRQLEDRCAGLEKQVAELTLYVFYF